MKRGIDVKLFADPAPMALTLGVWLCALPFVLLLTVPLFGLKVGTTIAAGLLVVLAAACRGFCAAKTGTLS